MKLSKTTNPLLPSQLKWLEDMEINNWKYEDGLVNVKGDVDIHNKNLTKIPVQFGYVSGYFDCSYNQLTSLSGSPKEVGGDFNCIYNQLTSLSGAPREVGGGFNCIYNQLTSLSGSPEEVGGNFYCWNNKFKIEPDHSYIKIGGRFEWQ
jgi:hypothetical protein